jgi:hypothetical protein
MNGSQNTQTQGNYFYHGVKGGPGYKPIAKIGYIQQEPHDYPQEESGPVSHFTAVRRKLKKGQKAPYVGGSPIFNQEPVEPGYYKLSDPFMDRGNVENANSQVPHDEKAEYKFPEDMRHAVRIDETALDAARAPHTWAKPDVEVDESEDKMIDYFANISDEALKSKKELLRLKGYSEEEINGAIKDLKEKEIQKNLKSANIVSLPSITTPQSVVMDNTVATTRPSEIQARAIGGRLNPNARTYVPRLNIQRSQNTTALDLAETSRSSLPSSMPSVNTRRLARAEAVFPTEQLSGYLGRRARGEATRFEEARFQAHLEAFAGVRRNVTQIPESQRSEPSRGRLSQRASTGQSQRASGRQTERATGIYGMGGRIR